MDKFRKLRADEIECRVSQINEKGLSLLLYKDARCDMRILDETVGPMHWQREHVLIDGQLFCRVGISDEHSGAFIWKEDVGTESNTEKEKGRASDSFKRACFNWGIGRELYTAPFIWIPAGSYTAYQKNGKYQTYDRFDVTSIGYDSDNIIQLTITNKKTQKTVFEMKGNNLSPAEKSAPDPSGSLQGCISAKDWATLKALCTGKNISPKEILMRYGYSKPSEIPLAMYHDMIKAISEGRL